MSDDLPDLTSYTPDQLREIRARLDALMVDVIKESRSCVDLVWHELNDVLVARGCRPMPTHVAKRQGWWATYLIASDDVIRFVTRTMRPKRTAHRIKAYKFLYELLAVSLEESGVPLSHRALAVNTSKIPGVVDQQFPGYVQNDLLHKVL